MLFEFFLYASSPFILHTIMQSLISFLKDKVSASQLASKRLFFSFHLSRRKFYLKVGKVSDKVSAKLRAANIVRLTFKKHMKR